MHIFSDQSGNSFTTIGDEIAVPMGDMKLSRLSGYMKIIEGEGSSKVLVEHWVSAVKWDLLWPLLN